MSRSGRTLRGSMQLRLLLIGSLPLLLITVLFTAYAIYSRQGDILHRVESFGERTAGYLANTLDFAFFALDLLLLGLLFSSLLFFLASHMYFSYKLFKVKL